LSHAANLSKTSTRRAWNGCSDAGANWATAAKTATLTSRHL
jgi:hypothetical protein